MLILVLVPTAAEAEGQANEKRIDIGEWLVLGPVAHPLPVFHDSDKGGFKAAKLLDETILPGSMAHPREDSQVSWFDGTPLTWRLEGISSDGTLTLQPPQAGPDDGRRRPAIAWLTAYLSTSRWQSTKLELRGSHPRKAWLDGKLIVTAGIQENEDAAPAETVHLIPGKHILVVQTVLDPARETDWSAGVSLTGFKEDFKPSTSVDPGRTVELRDIIDAPKITSLALSPDGRSIATTVNRFIPGTDDRETWIEVRDTSDGSMNRSWRGGDFARRIAWSPDGKYVSYIADAPGGSDDQSLSTLFLLDRQNNTAKPLLEGIDRLAGYRWSPTSASIVYWTTVKGEEFKNGVKRLEGLMDRWATYRDKSFLHLVTVPGGVRRQLTTGELTTSPVGFSPDGSRLLFTREVEHLTERPYSKTELWELSLTDFSASKLRDFSWFGGASYSPDGTQLLVAAQAAAFGDAGTKVGNGEIPNSYDTQLFLWNPSTSEVEAIARDFDPSVGNALWSRADGNIYLTAEDRDYRRMYRYNVNEKSFEAVETGYDMFSSLDVADNSKMAAGLGQSPWVPESLVVVDLNTLEAKQLPHPADEWFSEVESGTIQTWSFEASTGKTIDGRIYLPPGFDAQRKYPLIVYYYGGTSPVGRSYGGRYPKEWWAATGYVVYVLQPSGATGFGQEFSARHVNDWGKTTSEEIIEGTRKFLDAHRFVDPDRVGCIGASYGGFMTMLLSTRTDVFSAAVAHAGISSISSYWGEGYWGYSYSAVATADSFPWDRKDIYVEQSPLFRADKARVPILLTHGTSDTNVPKGESDAFYIALKLLGKTVEYIQVEGQDHHILAHDKRVVWSSTILAWFDRWLKDQPEWWDELYP
jgi:dipeptidyl aminopeptidase/acylaminoacyl peptidase